MEIILFVIITKIIFFLKLFGNQILKLKEFEFLF